MNLANLSCAMLASLIVSAVGCGSSHNITKTDGVQRTGMIGKCYVLKQDVLLQKSDGPPGRLVTQDIRIRDKVDLELRHVIATLHEGTRFSVTRVEQYSLGPFATAPSPLYA